MAPRFAADSLLETMDTSLHAARMPAPGSLQTRRWRKADSNSVPSDRAVSKQGWQLLITLGGSALERARIHGQVRSGAGLHKRNAGLGHRILQDGDRRCPRQAMLAAQKQKSADQAVATVSVVVTAARPVAAVGKMSDLKNSVSRAPQS
jgi:hypothetical protein